MNNEVIFSVKILMDGQEKFAQATTSSKELGAAINQVSNNSRQLNDELINTNQRVQAFQNIFAGMQQIVDVTKEMTDMYAGLEVENTKLITVMKKRMDAQDSDIQSVRQVIAAQKELGIISGTVQTAGSQQMATFLNQKSSLEILIPAMNNLIAQQDGLNATQENAVSIGNMMGKAMQGQTEVLQRVGVTFTEAQKEVLKYGDEQQRAATLAQVIKDNVGDMNAELAKTDAGEAKKRTMWFNTLKASIGGTLSEVQPLIVAFNQIGMTSFALIQVKNGFTAIIGSISLATIATSANTTATRICTGVQNMHKAAMIQLTAATGSATVAATALTAAYTMGLSIAITGIVMLISHLCNSENDAKKNTEALTAANENAKSKQDELNQTYADTKTGLSLMIEKIKDFHGNKEQEKKLVTECNTKYGETMGYYASISDWYKVLVANSETYCTQLVNEARMRQLANQAANAQTEAHDIKYNADGSTKTYSKERETKDVWVSTAGGSYRTEEEIAGTSELEKSQASYNQKIKESINSQKQMGSVLKEQAGLQEKLHAQIPGTKQFDTMQEADDSTKKGKAKKNEGRPMDDAEIATASYKDLGDAITYYQKKLDGTKSSDTESINRLSIKIAALDQAQKKIKDTQNAVSTIPGSLNDLDGQIKKLQNDRNNATEETIVGIDSQIDKLKKQRTELENQGISQKKLTDLNTYEDLSSALSYYQDRMKTANESERVEIQKTITLINEKTAAMQRVDQASSRPTNTGTISSLTEQTNWLKQQQENSGSGEVAGYQTQINAIEAEKSALQGLIDIENDHNQLNKLSSVGTKELKIELKEIGFDAITEKIRKLQQMLTDPSMKLDDKMRTQIQTQISGWSSYQQTLAKSQLSFKQVYGGLKSVGNGITDVGDALKGNGTVWQKTTKIVDSGLEVYEGVSEVIKLMKTLGLITDVQRTKETAYTAVKLAGSVVTTSASAATATASATDAAAMSIEFAAVSGMTAGYSALAAAKTFAAHASLMFVGTGIASGMVATQQAIIAAASIPKFAEGGIAYGATLGLFGEYPGASGNPEVVAPLDRLKNLIGPREQANTGGGTVKFVLHGRELWGLLEKEGLIKSRS